MFSTGTKSVGKSKAKTSKATKKRSRVVTKTSIGTGTKSVGSTRGIKVTKSSTKVSNPKPKRPSFKPLQLG